MTLLARLRSFLRALGSGSRLDAEMDHELRFHLDERIAHLVAEGLSPEAAAAQARREFGGLTSWREQGREARGLRMLDELRADLGYGWRQLRRAPLFTLAASLSLALGIGANVAIFSLANITLIKSLPVARPAELVQVMHAGQRGASGSSNYQWFRRLEDRRDLFAALIGVRAHRVTVEVNGQPEHVLGQRILGDYYGTLGVGASWGRVFRPDDADAPGVAVISDSYWRRRFGADPGVIGRSISIDGANYAVVGVTPPGFFGLQVGRMADVTTAMDVRSYDEPGSWTSVPILGRLLPTTNVARAERELAGTVAQMSSDQRLSENARNAGFQRVELRPARNGLSTLRDQFADPLRVLFGVVVVLLALACVNLAGLLVSRNASREREISTRLALGARRGRIVRQLITESALLAGAGAFAGVLGGWATSRALVTMLPHDGLPRSISTDPDGTVLLFTVAVASLAVLVFGVWPAFRASRTELTLVTREPRVSHFGSGLGKALVAVQMTLAVVLIAGASLLIRTLVNLANVDAGFSRHGVVTAELDFENPTGQVDPFDAQRRVLDELRRTPGIDFATLGTITPLSGTEQGRPVVVPGSLATAVDDRSAPPGLGVPGSIAQINSIAGQYFETFGIPLVVGRGISDRDIAAMPRVVVVSETFARQHYGGGPALGRRFRIGGGRPAEYEVVGVARDVRYRHLRQDGPPIVYVSQFQLPEDVMDVAIRTTLDERAAGVALQRALHAALPELPFADAASVSGRITTLLWRERLVAALSTFFAVVAIVLAAIGTYALFAHLVARRRFELGIRVALGATSSSVFWLVLRQALLLAAVGGVAGVAIAAVSLRGLESLLFELPSTDVITLALSAGILAAVALIAAAVPARRAATVDPLSALRSE